MGVPIFTEVDRGYEDGAHDATNRDHQRCGNAILMTLAPE